VSVARRWPGAGRDVLMVTLLLPIYRVSRPGFARHRQPGTGRHNSPQAPVVVGDGREIYEGGLKEVLGDLVG
jgi:hypothetical protein